MVGPWRMRTHVSRLNLAATAMGLTIHYAINANTRGARAARHLVNQWHDAAGRLPFTRIDDVRVWTSETSAQTDRMSAPYWGSQDVPSWVSQDARQMVHTRLAYMTVMPIHVVGFKTWPGAGCEPAAFGLALYPPQIAIGPNGTGIVPTQLDGWQWRSFCKTQYASDPGAGVVANFLRCHLVVIRLLDEIARLGGVGVTVNDESGYWTHRDVRRLAEEVGEWNEAVGAVVRRIRDGRNSTPGE